MPPQQRRETERSTQIYSFAQGPSWWTTISAFLAGPSRGMKFALRPSDVRSLSEATRWPSVEEQEEVRAGALRIES
jgi:hypothetical protein